MFNRARFVFVLLLLLIVSFFSTSERVLAQAVVEDESIGGVRRLSSTDSTPAGSGVLDVSGGLTLNAVGGLEALSIGGTDYTFDMDDGGTLAHLRFTETTGTYTLHFRSSVTVSGLDGGDATPARAGAIVLGRSSGRDLATGAAGTPGYSFSSFTLSGDAVLNLRTLDFWGSSSTFTLDGATAKLLAGIVTVANSILTSLILSNGEVGIDALNVNASNRLQVNGVIRGFITTATFAGTSTLDINSTGSITIDDVNLNSGAGHSVAGTLNSATIDVGNGATLTINGGTVDASGAVTVLAGGTLAFGGTGGTLNAASLVFQTIAPLTIGTGSTVEVTGEIRVFDLRLNGGTLKAATYTDVGAGALLTLTAGTLNIDTLKISRRFLVGGVIAGSIRSATFFTTSTLDINAGASIRIGDLNLNGGTAHDVAGTLNSEVITVGTGSVLSIGGAAVVTVAEDDATLTLTTETRVTGTLNIGGTAAFTSTNLFIESGGEVHVTGGSLSVSGTFSNAGTLRFSGGTSAVPVVVSGLPATGFGSVAFGVSGGVSYLSLTGDISSDRAIEVASSMEINVTAGVNFNADIVFTQVNKYLTILGSVLTHATGEGKITLNRNTRLLGQFVGFNVILTAEASVGSAGTGDIVIGDVSSKDNYIDLNGNTLTFEAGTVESNGVLVRSAAAGGAITGSSSTKGDYDIKAVTTIGDGGTITNIGVRGVIRVAAGQTLTLDRATVRDLQLASAAAGGTGSYISLAAGSTLKFTGIGLNVNALGGLDITLLGDARFEFDAGISDGSISLVKPADGADAEDIGVIYSQGHAITVNVVGVAENTGSDAIADLNRIFNTAVAGVPETVGSLRVDDGTSFDYDGRTGVLSHTVTSTLTFTAAGVLRIGNAAAVDAAAVTIRVSRAGGSEPTDASTNAEGIGSIDIKSTGTLAIADDGVVVVNDIIVAGTLTNAGTLTVGNLDIASGGVVSVTGGSLSATTISNAGTLRFSGGTNAVPVVVSGFSATGTGSVEFGVSGGATSYLDLSGGDISSDTAIEVVSNTVIIVPVGGVNVNADIAVAAGIAFEAGDTHALTYPSGTGKITLNEGAQLAGRFSGFDIILNGDAQQMSSKEIRIDDVGSSDNYIDLNGKTFTISGNIRSKNVLIRSAVAGGVIVGSSTFSVGDYDIKAATTFGDGGATATSIDVYNSVIRVAAGQTLTLNEASFRDGGGLGSYISLAAGSTLKFGAGVNVNDLIGLDIVLLGGATFEFEAGIQNNAISLVNGGNVGVFYSQGKAITVKIGNDAPITGAAAVTRLGEIFGTTVDVATRLPQILGSIHVINADNFNYNGSTDALSGTITSTLTFAAGGVLVIGNDAGEAVTIRVSKSEGANSEGTPTNVVGVGSIEIKSTGTLDIAADGVVVVNALSVAGSLTNAGTLTVGNLDIASGGVVSLSGASVADGSNSGNFSAVTISNEGTLRISRGGISGFSAEGSGSIVFSGWLGLTGDISSTSAIEAVSFVTLTVTAGVNFNADIAVAAGATLAIVTGTLIHGTGTGKITLNEGARLTRGQFSGFDILLAADATVGEEGFDDRIVVIGDGSSGDNYIDLNGNTLTLVNAISLESDGDLIRSATGTSGAIVGAGSTRGDYNILASTTFGNAGTTVTNLGVRGVIKVAEGQTLTLDTATIRDLQAASAKDGGIGSYISLAAGSTLKFGAGVNVNDLRGLDIVLLGGATFEFEAGIADGAISLVNADTSDTGVIYSQGQDISVKIGTDPVITDVPARERLNGIFGTTVDVATIVVALTEVVGSLHVNDGTSFDYDGSTDALSDTVTSTLTFTSAGVLRIGNDAGEAVTIRVSKSGGLGSTSTNGVDVGSIDIKSTGTLDIAADGVVVVNALSVAGTLTNAGTLTVGNLDIASGVVVSVTADGSFSATTISNAGTLRFSGGSFVAPVVVSGFSATGDGSVEFGVSGGGYSYLRFASVISSASAIEVVGDTAITVVNSAAKFNADIVVGRAGGGDVELFISLSGPLRHGTGNGKITLNEGARLRGEFFGFDVILAGDADLGFSGKSLTIGDGSSGDNYIDLNGNTLRFNAGEISSSGILIKSAITGGAIVGAGSTRGDYDIKASTTFGNAGTTATNLGVRGVIKVAAGQTLTLNEATVRDLQAASVAAGGTGSYISLAAGSTLKFGAGVNVNDLRGLDIVLLGGATFEFAAGIENNAISLVNGSDTGVIYSQGKGISVKIGADPVITGAAAVTRLDEIFGTTVNVDAIVAARVVGSLHVNDGTSFDYDGSTDVLSHTTTSTLTFTSTGVLRIGNDAAADAVTITVSEAGGLGGDASTNVEGIGSIEIKSTGTLAIADDGVVVVNDIIVAGRLTSSGILTVGSSFSVSAGQSVVIDGGVATLSGLTLADAANTKLTVSGVDTEAFVSGGTVSSNSNAIIDVLGGATFDSSGALSAGTVTVDTTSGLTLSGGEVGIGVLNANGGTILVDGVIAGSIGSATFAGGVLDINTDASITIDDVNLNSGTTHDVAGRLTSTTIDVGSATRLTISGGTVDASGAVTVASGGGALIFSGTGSTLNAASLDIKSGAGTLTIGVGATVEVSGAVTSAAAVTLQGTGILRAATYTATADLTLSGGAVGIGVLNANAGTIAVNGVIAGSIGSATFAGGVLDINTAASITIDDVNLNSGTTHDVAGRLTSTTIDVGVAGVVGTRLTISGGTVDASGVVTVASTGALAFDATDGGILKAASLALQTTTALTIGTGATVEVSGAVTSAAVVTLQSGGTLKAATYSATVDLTLSGGAVGIGVLNATSGTVAVNGVITGSIGSAIFDGGTLDINGGGSITIGDINLNSGTAHDVLGTLASEVIAVGSSSVLSIGGAAVVTVAEDAATATLTTLTTVAGTLNIAGTAAFTSTNLDIASGGVVSVTGGSFGVSGTLSNVGTLRFSGGTDAARIGISGFSATATGFGSVEFGVPSTTEYSHLDLSGDISSDRAIEVVSNTAIYVANAGAKINADIVVGTVGGGQINLFVGTGSSLTHATGNGKITLNGQAALVGQFVDFDVILEGNATLGTAGSLTIGDGNSGDNYIDLNGKALRFDGSTIESDGDLIRSADAGGAITGQASTRGDYDIKATTRFGDGGTTVTNLGVRGVIKVAEGETLTLNEATIRDLQDASAADGGTGSYISLAAGSTLKFGAGVNVNDLRGLDIVLLGGATFEFESGIQDGAISLVNGSDTGVIYSQDQTITVKIGTDPVITGAAAVTRLDGIFGTVVDADTIVVALAEVVGSIHVDADAASFNYDGSNDALSHTTTSTLTFTAAGVLRIGNDAADGKAVTITVSEAGGLGGDASTNVEGIGSIEIKSTGRLAIADDGVVVVNDIIVAGRLTSSGILTVGSSFSVSAGQSVVIDGGVATLSGLTLADAANTKLTVSGVDTEAFVSGGTVSSNSNAIIDVLGGATFDSSGALSAGTVTVDTTSTSGLTLSGGEVGIGVLNANGGTVLVDGVIAGSIGSATFAGGVLDINTGASITIDDVNLNSGTTHDVAGRLTSTTIDVGSATRLTISGGTVDASGAVTVASGGGALIFSGTGSTLKSASLDIKSGAGTLTIGVGATVEVSGAVTSAAAVTLQGTGILRAATYSATADLALSGGAVGIGVLNANAGTIAVNGVIAGSIGSATFAGGVLDINAAASITIDDVNLNSGTTHDVAGRLTSTTIDVGVAGVVGTRLTISGGTVDASGAVTVASTGALAFDATDGGILKAASLALQTTTALTIGTGATVEVSGAVTSAAAVTLQSGGTLKAATYSATVDLTLSGGAVGIGVLNATSGTVAVNGVITGSIGSAIFDGGTLDINGGGSIRIGDVNLNSGASHDVLGTLNSEVIAVGSSSVLSIGGAAAVTVSEDGSTDRQTTVTIAGTLNVGDSAVFTSTKLDIASGGVVSVTGGSFSATTISNVGTLRFSGGTDAARIGISGFSATATGSGSIVFGELGSFSNLNLSGNISSDRAIEVVSDTSITVAAGVNFNANIAVTGATNLLVDGGTLTHTTGTGQIRLDAGAALSNGEFAGFDVILAGDADVGSSGKSLTIGDGDSDNYIDLNGKTLRFDGGAIVSPDVLIKSATGTGSAIVGSAETTGDYDISAATTIGDGGTTTNLGVRSVIRVAEGETLTLNEATVRDLQDASAKDGGIGSYISLAAGSTLKFIGGAGVNALRGLDIVLLGGATFEFDAGIADGAISLVNSDGSTVDTGVIYSQGQAITVKIGTESPITDATAARERLDGIFGTTVDVDTIVVALTQVVGSLHVTNADDFDYNGNTDALSGTTTSTLTFTSAGVLRIGNDAGGEAVTIRVSRAGGSDSTSTSTNAVDVGSIEIKSTGRLDIAADGVVVVKDIIVAGSLTSSGTFKAATYSATASLTLSGGTVNIGVLNANGGSTVLVNGAIGGSIGSATFAGGILDINAAGSIRIGDVSISTGTHGVLGTLNSEVIAVGSGSVLNIGGAAVVTVSDNTATSLTTKTTVAGILSIGDSATFTSTNLGIQSGGSLASTGELVVGGVLTVAGSGRVDITGGADNSIAGLDFVDDSSVSGSPVLLIGGTSATAATKLSITGAGNSHNSVGEIIISTNGVLDSSGTLYADKVRFAGSGSRSFDVTGGTLHVNTVEGVGSDALFDVSGTVEIGTDLRVVLGSSGTGTVGLTGQLTLAADLIANLDVKGASTIVTKGSQRTLTGQLSSGTASVAHSLTFGSSTSLGSLDLKFAGIDKVILTVGSGTLKIYDTDTGIDLTSDTLKDIVLGTGTTLDGSFRSHNINIVVADIGSVTISGGSIDLGNGVIDANGGDIAFDDVTIATSSLENVGTISGTVDFAKDLLVTGGSDGVALFGGSTKSLTATFSSGSSLEVGAGLDLTLAGTLTSSVGSSIKLGSGSIFSGAGTDGVDSVRGFNFDLSGDARIGSTGTSLSIIDGSSDNYIDPKGNELTLAGTVASSGILVRSATAGSVIVGEAKTSGDYVFSAATTIGKKGVTTTLQIASGTIFVEEGQTLVLSDAILEELTPTGDVASGIRIELGAGSVLDVSDVSVDLNNIDIVLASSDVTIIANTANTIDLEDAKIYTNGYDHKIKDQNGTVLADADVYTVFNNVDVSTSSDDIVKLLDDVTTVDTTLISSSSPDALDRLIDKADGVESFNTNLKSSYDDLSKAIGAGYSTGGGISQELYTAITKIDVASATGRQKLLQSLEIVSPSNNDMNEEIVSGLSLVQNRVVTEAAYGGISGLISSAPSSGGTLFTSSTSGAINETGTFYLAVGDTGYSSSNYSVNDDPSYDVQRGFLIWTRAFYGNLDVDNKTIDNINYSGYDSSYYGGIFGVSTSVNDNFDISVYLSASKIDSTVNNTTGVASTLSAETTNISGGLIGSFNLADNFSIFGSLGYGKYNTEGSRDLSTLSDGNNITRSKSDYSTDVISGSFGLKKDFVYSSDVSISARAYTNFSNLDIPGVTEQSDNGDFILNFKSRKETKVLVGADLQVSSVFARDDIGETILNFKAGLTYDASSDNKELSYRYGNVGAYSILKTRDDEDLSVLISPSLVYKGKNFSLGLGYNGVFDFDSIVDHSGFVSFESNF